MNAYGALAASYDRLTNDVDYKAWVDFAHAILEKEGLKPHTAADLACGTGTMTGILTERGSELIAVDGSADMLAEAREKAYDLTGEPPVFLNQSMPELDLYGTVDAAICCLDSINYLTSPRDVKKTFRRLHLFIAPGGLLVFDINSIEKLRSLDGQVFLDETEDIYCVWRTEFEKRSRICTYWMDIFTRGEDELWERDFEEHRQRAYEVEELRTWLEEAGFTNVRTYGDCRMSAPRENEQRIYFTAIRK